MRGPGYLRYRRRLGESGAEQLRLKVLAEQEAALDRAERDREKVQPRDRTTYRDYPPPAGRRRR